MKKPKSKKTLEEQLRELARIYSARHDSDSEAFRQMKRVLQDELGY